MKTLVTSALIALSLSVPAMAQENFAAGATSFESETAILDTSVPFTIGAREARQELRGAFGWSTFQEGQVNGVYYRFDPDGYARFSSAPRLDSDVFEVICRPRTVTCMARKDTLSVMLNSRGQVQLTLENHIPGDSFFLSEGLNEVPVPERILQPLDPQVEALLSTGGELVVRRGDKETQRVSLGGFFAVVAYLRWIAAGQDYAVLPRGWPVPNARPAANTVESAGFFPGAGAAAYPTQPPSPFASDGRALSAAAAPAPEVAQVRSEIDALRKMLVRQSAQGADGTVLAASESAPVISIASPKRTGGTAEEERIARLEQTTKELLREIEVLRSGGGAAGMPARDLVEPSFQTSANPPSLLPPDSEANVDAARRPNVMLPETEMPPSRSGSVSEKARRTAQRLQYLMTEIGLDAKTALILAQLGDQNEQPSTTEGPPVEPRETASAYQAAIVRDILADLEGQMPTVEPQTEVATGIIAGNPADVTPEEYRLLSRYFRSVFDERSD